MSTAEPLPPQITAGPAAPPPMPDGGRVTLADLNERCDVMEIPKATCAHCRKLPDPFVRDHRPSRAFVAVYAGSCVDCGTGFGAGDRISWSDEGGGYLGPCCGGEG